MWLEFLLRQHYYISTGNKIRGMKSTFILNVVSSVAEFAGAGFSCFNGHGLVLKIFFFFFT